MSRMSRRCSRRGSAAVEVFDRGLRWFLGLLPGWRPPRRTPYNWMPNSSGRVRQTPCRFVSVWSAESVV